MTFTPGTIPRFIRAAWWTTPPSTSLTGQAVYFDEEVLFDPEPSSLVTNGSFEDGSGTSATGWNQDARWTRVGAQAL